MTNELRRDILRKYGIDIEVTVVTTIKENTSYHSGYRYLISVWGEDKKLVKNIYTDEVFDSYEKAEVAAIAYSATHLLDPKKIGLTTLTLPRYVD